jgi:hypothetical protein
MSAFPGARPALRTLFVGLVALGFAACGGDDDPSGPNEDQIAAWLDGVEASGASSVDFETGAAPAASGGPALDADLTGSFITGGTTTLTVDGATFDGLILALQGVDGYVDVEYATDRSSATVAVTLEGDLPAGAFTLRVAGRQGSEVGAYVTIPVNVVQVGSGGPIQVSVSWDTPSDVDLHVIDPSGEEIYYANPVGDTGGELDLDSNAACGIDGVNNENITWDDDDNPSSGTYTVLVHYWSPCGQGTTNYIVTVRVEGEATRTFAGTLTTDDEEDQVTTFTY